MLTLLIAFAMVFFSGIALAEKPIVIGCPLSTVSNTAAAAARPDANIRASAPPSRGCWLKQKHSVL